MRRVMILMADRTHANLRVHQTFGLPKEAAALNFVVSQSTVLQRLLAQQAQVRINPTTTHSFPPCCRRPAFAVRGEHLLLRSLVNNGRVIMIVVADQGGGPFAEITVQAFGKTAQCIEKPCTALAAVADEAALQSPLCALETSHV
jgi:hypothetical protein